MTFPLPFPVRLLLFPLSLLYRLVVSLRPLLYRRGVFRIHRAAVPVVSVGNLTVGGSGKTPMVEVLVQWCRSAGLKPVVLSRGYGSRSQGDLYRVCLAEGTPARPELMGDEPFLLAQRNPKVAFITGKDRVAAARLAVTIDQPDLLLLDDAFQHLRLARDLNILLVDAERGLDGGRLLPGGALREPAAALHRADVILVTKAEADRGDALRQELREHHGASMPIFTCGYLPARLTRLDGGAVLPAAALSGRRVTLLCAIAQPQGFVQAVEGLGATVGELRTRRDHYPYPAADLALLDVELQHTNGEGPQWITTEKDAVKLRGKLQHPQRLWVLEMEVVPEPAAEAYLKQAFAQLAAGRAVDTGA